jgi:hypothetical protein
MAAPNLDEFNVATRVEIMPSVADGFFKAGPIIAYMKANRMKLFEGGTEIQENLLYRPMKGGFYQTGQGFNTTRSQTTLGTRFKMKKAYVNVSEQVDDIEIELRSPHAAFDKVRTDLANAALTMSAILEIASWQHGQDLTGVGGANQIAAFNGIAEALNDGTTASWDGSTHASYGGQARVDANKALYPAGQATPGTYYISPNVNGKISNHVMEHTYLSCVIGQEYPRMGIGANRVMGYINELYAGMQRLADTVEPVIGWPGLKFKQATLITSQYAPGEEGENDPDIGNYSTGAGNGEVFAWINPGPEGDDAFMRLHISASEKFQFGFTGWKVGRDDNMVAGQILFAGNLIWRLLRLMRVLTGIKG